MKKSIEKEERSKYSVGENREKRGEITRQGEQTSGIHLKYSWETTFVEGYELEIKSYTAALYFPETARFFVVLKRPNCISRQSDALVDTELLVQCH